MNGKGRVNGRILDKYKGKYKLETIQKTMIELFILLSGIKFMNKQLKLF